MFLNWLRGAWPFVLVTLFCLILWRHGQSQWNEGYEQAEAQGKTALSELRLEYAEQTRIATADNFLRYQQQVARASEAEALLFQNMEQRSTEKQQLEERIQHVTSQFRPAPGAKPQPVPHCVFTVGWLRDYNTALGVPGASTGSVANRTGQATWAAPGTDAELLASGVTPADILSHATDYGNWARRLADQVRALLHARENTP